MKLRSSQTKKKRKWIEVQKKAFQVWVNTYLVKLGEDHKIDDIQTGFSDGVKLVEFLEKLLKKEVGKKYSKNPRLKVHKITNCFIALKFLEEQGVKGLTIAAEDIVEGDKLNLILGFCWMLLRQFQATPDFGDDDENGGKGSNFESRMLEWAKSILSDYPDITITGFDSFNDGKALLALLEKYDKKIVNYRGFDKQDPFINSKVALELAEQYMQIPRELIDAQELVDGQVSDKQMVLYLTLFYNAFSDKDNVMSRENIVGRIRDLERELDHLTNDRNKLIDQTQDLDGRTITLEQTLVTISHQRDELSEWKRIKAEEWRIEKEAMLVEIAKLQEILTELKSKTDDATSGLQKNNEKLRNERDELLKDTQKLEKELEEMGSKFTKLTKKVDKENRAKKDLTKFIKNQEEEWGVGIGSLRRNLLQHIHDTNIWKQFLEQNDDYKIDPEELHKDSDISPLPFPEQISTLDKALTEETDRFRELLDEKSKTTRAVEALVDDKLKNTNKKKKKKGKDKKN